MRSADLRQAELTADLSRADLSHADLRGADLRGAYRLLETTLSGAEYDKKTRWPRDFDPQLPGAILVSD